MSYKACHFLYNWCIPYDIYNKFSNMYVINIISYLFLVSHKLNIICILSFVRVFMFIIFDITHMKGLISYVEHNTLISILYYIYQISYHIYLRVILQCSYLFYWSLHISYSIYVFPYNSETGYIRHNPTPHIQCQ